MFPLCAFSGLWAVTPNWTSRTSTISTCLSRPTVASPSSTEHGLASGLVVHMVGGARDGRRVAPLGPMRAMPHRAGWAVFIRCYRTTPRQLAVGGSPTTHMLHLPAREGGLQLGGALPILQAAPSQSKITKALARIHAPTRPGQHTSTAKHGRGRSALRRMCTRLPGLTRTLRRCTSSPTVPSPFRRGGRKGCRSVWCWRSPGPCSVASDDLLLCRIRADGQAGICMRDNSISAQCRSLGNFD